MGRINERYLLLEKTLETLNSSIKKLQEVEPESYYYTELRDSSIQRFEYSLDTLWKYLKEYLQIKHGIQAAASPKTIFKQCLDLKEISETEHAILRDMVEDRNLTSHAYNVELAEKIAYAIPDYYTHLYAIFSKTCP